MIGDVRPVLAPQRLAPRFAAAADLASHWRPGLRLLDRVAGWATTDRTITSGDRPAPADAAWVVAFPRTGSRFLAKAAAMALDAPVAHLHDAGYAALGVEAGVPVLVPAREPVATVVSWAIYHGDAPRPELARRRLHAYVAWHRHVLRLPSIAVAAFETCIDDPSGALAPLLGGAPGPTAEEVRLALAAEDAERPWRTANLPRHERAALRSMFRDAVTAPSNARLLAQAVDLHARMRALAPVAPATSARR